MQENEFEKSIREKMERLRFEPTEDVWKKVSEKIREEKKRRRILFFLLPATLLIGFTGFYILMNSTTPTNTIVSKNNTGTPSRKSDTISTKPSISPGIQNLPQAQKENDSELQRAAETRRKAVDNSELYQEKEYKKEVIAREKKASTFLRKDENNLSLKDLKNSQVDSKVKEDKINQINDAVPGSTNLSADVKSKKNDSVNKKAGNYPDSVKLSNPRTKSIDSIKPVVLETKTILKPKVSPVRKWRLGFTAFSGISNNVEGLSASGKSSVSYSAPNLSNAFQSNSPFKLSYSPAFTYGVGIYLKRSFSKRIDFSAGLNYHFLSATSRVGTRVASNQNIYDSSLGSNTRVNQVYAPGQTTNYRNKYGALEVPLNIFLQLNKNQNKKLLLTAGVTPAYLVGATSLYANNSQNLYYETKEQFKKMIWSLQCGLQFSVLNTRVFNIVAGPEFQYGINNMAKAATGTNQHLTSASFKVAVTL